jgi:hypothetical protein
VASTLGRISKSGGGSLANQPWLARLVTFVGRVGNDLIGNGTGRGVGAGRRPGQGRRNRRRPAGTVACLIGQDGGQASPPPEEQTPSFGSRHQVRSGCCSSRALALPPPHSDHEAARNLLRSYHGVAVTRGLGICVLSARRRAGGFTYERAPELRVLRVSFCVIRHSLLPKRLSSVLFSKSYVRSGPRGA